MFAVPIFFTLKGYIQYVRIFELEREMNKDHKKLVEHSLENSDKYERSVKGVRIHFSQK